jgi:hypothetical protein
LCCPLSLSKGARPASAAGFLATDTAEFGHANQERQAVRSPIRDAQHEAQSDSEIAVSAQLPGNETDLGSRRGGQSVDLCKHQAPQAGSPICSSRIL